MTVCILYNHKQQTIQIPNNKHQITNKSQITIFNDLNANNKDCGYFDFSSFDEKPDSFSELKRPLLKIVYRFGILNLGHWNLFVICDLRFVISIVTGL